MEVAEWKWPPILFLRPPLFIIIIIIVVVVILLLVEEREADADGGGSVQIILNYEVINDNGSYQKAGEILHKFIFTLGKRLQINFSV